jgi:hypothetical protein
MDTSKDNQFTDSIFDQDLDGNFKLWTGCPEDHPMNYPLSTAQKLLTGIVGKKSSRRSEKNQIRDRFYVLTPEYLYFKKNEEAAKISGFLNLKWARMEVHTEDYEDQNGQVKTKFTIKIIKNLKFTSMFFDDYRDFYTWKQALIKVHVVQTDFHEKFKVLERLGKGAFARVSILNLTKLRFTK